MFYALTQETEETYFADNMSAFIALAPCMISPTAPYDYETFIATEWQALDDYPNIYGENYSSTGWCEETGNGVYCSFLPLIEGFPGVESTDTRSLFQLSQVALEKRFQAWSEDYDTPEGRQTELADITKIDKVPVYLINAAQDTNCESPEGVEKMSQDIPSFAKKWQLDPYGHMDFMAPVGEQGKKQLEYIQEAMKEVEMSGASFFTTTLLASFAALATILF